MNHSTRNIIHYAKVILRVISIPSVGSTFCITLREHIADLFDVFSAAVNVQLQLKSILFEITVLVVKTLSLTQSCYAFVEMISVGRTLLTVMVVDLSRSFLFLSLLDSPGALP